MKRNKLWLFTVSLVFMLAFGAVAQKSKPQKSTKKPAAEKVDKPAQVSSGHEEKVKDLVLFFQLLLNTLGSDATSARDKEVVITQSYAKVFRDDKVQVEDDLDAKRTVITNKDIVAYLKDVDFFFKDVRFELLIDKIEQGVNANRQIFYKVSLRRNMKGTTASGEAVNNTIPRFIEVNYDPAAEELKIVSIYTNEFDQKESLTNWWSQLSFEWKAIFKRNLKVVDSVSLNDIKDMMALNELDLSGNDFVLSIEPLGQLTNLRLLNLSATGVTDLTPIRNLTELVELDLSSTKVFDLTPLRYSTKLARLNISHTEIRSIAVLEKMPAMQSLEMQASHVIDFRPLSTLAELTNLNLEGTQIASLGPVETLAKLTDLNIAKTFVQDLSPVKELEALASLNIDSTLIRDIRPLVALENLEVLYANYTFISDLSPLQKLPKIERIYCDQTPVKKPIADAFMASRPSVLVIYDSRDLQAWWNTLSPEWRMLLSKAARVRVMPGKEELAVVTNLDSINLGNDRAVTTLEPLRKLLKLRVVLANNTAITDLSALEDHRDIEFLNISDTEVTDLSPLSKLSRLEVFIADRSKLEKLDPLFNLRQLKEVYVDRTAIHDITAQEFLQKNSDCLLVYKTIHLDRWWENLSEGWREILRVQMGNDTTSTRENLHKLVEKEVMHIDEGRVRDLSALEEFIRLQELHFSGTGIMEIPDMASLRSLRSLHATNSPLKSIGAISQLKDLEDLNISNTPIDDLRGLEGLDKLRSINCAGTQVKKLDPLQSLHQLESVDCSNTRVSRLDPVMYLSVRTLKCYNTKVSTREVDQFRGNNPDCHIVYYR
jgi:Leucine-rich repeat (LRR) protein